jgi:hypothetical protein
METTKITLEETLNDLLLNEIIDNFRVIDYTTGERLPIKLRGYQLEILQSMINNKFVSVKACRQSGKSLIVKIYALFCFFKNKTVLYHGPNQGTCDDFIRDILGFLNTVSKEGIFVKKTKSMTVKKHEEWLEFPKSFLKGRIKTSSGKNLLNKGMSFDSIIIDEAAFCKIERQLFDEVIPVCTARKNDKLILLSTPNGFNYFSAIHKGENNFIKHDVYYYDVDKFNSEEWKNQMIKCSGEEKFNQECLCHFHSKIQEEFNNHMHNVPYVDGGPIPPKSPYSK